MKNIISVLLIIILFQSCVEESNRNTTIDLIKKVETGLPIQVYIAGDSIWSIEERMEHYILNYSKSLELNPQNNLKCDPFPITSLLID